MVDNTLTVVTSTTAALLLGQDTARRGIIICNIDATDTIYIGTSPVVSSTTGYAIPKLDKVYIQYPNFDPTTNWYAVASANTPRATILIGRS